MPLPVTKTNASLAQPLNSNAHVPFIVINNHLNNPNI
jgi:hypothetical protein